MVRVHSRADSGPVYDAGVGAAVVGADVGASVCARTIPTIAAATATNTRRILCGCSHYTMWFDPDIAETGV